jgi:hypothetical protein
MRPGFQTFLDIRAALRSRNDQRFFASLRMTFQYEIAWTASDPPLRPDLGREFNS